ncbi:MAG: hypothetical protein KKE23_00485 [Nanoarchaeota archaeon]|nr:hypothetical protein [Nanoarchaeota archaeon]
MSRLQSIAIITAIIGIIAIIFLSSNLEPKEMMIVEIDRGMVGEYVKVIGNISNIKHSKITSFTIKDDSSDIYAFSYENLDLDKGRYEIIGKVNEYYGSLEIEINKMENII